jgi:hypothetical protein
MAIKSGRTTGAGYVARMGDIRNAYFGKHGRKMPLRTLRLEISWRRKSDRARFIAEQFAILL